MLNKLRHNHNGKTPVLDKIEHQADVIGQHLSGNLKCAQDYAHVQFDQLKDYISKNQGSLEQKAGITALAFAGFAVLALGGYIAAKFLNCNKH